jgi:thiosulfate dehydrogenase
MRALRFLRRVARPVMRPVMRPGMRPVAALLLAAACDVVELPDGSVPPLQGEARAPFVVPAANTIPDGPIGASVRRGRAILEATRDSMPAFVGNDLRCASCHLDSGLRKDAMPWVGVYSRFPQYRARSGRVIDLEERIADCFVRSLNGRAPEFASSEMRDMVAYMAWLSREVPVGRRMDGEGMPAVAPHVPDTSRGRAVFLAECARCHGEDGQGLLPPAPPVWGPRSFNIGAGMSRLRTAAAFLKVAMPLDRPGTLTDQQAYDVAAYINSRGRPDLAGKENDWPNGDPPPDVAYPTRAAERPHLPR